MNINGVGVSLVYMRQRIHELDDAPLRGTIDNRILSANHL